MDALDRLIPTPRLLERDVIELAAPPDRVWEVARHLDMSRVPIVRALFALRTAPSRLGDAGAEQTRLRIDDLRSTPEQPGFAILVDDPPRELAVGAIGKVWHLDIPFIHVPDADAFARFYEPGEVKVAWAIEIEPYGASDTRLALELRVDATDDDTWRKFRRYFHVVGPASRFIRRSLLHGLERELGTPRSREDSRALPGDELLPDANGQVTQAVTIDAPAAAIWPWLVQMGCHRGGFYSYDVLDNGNVPSARELHPELQNIQVGDILPATPGSSSGFEVLRIAPNEALVLGGLFDPAAGAQLRFAAARPERYWHVTWAFVLEPLEPRKTRLHVRGRASFPQSGRFHAAWVRPVHAFMESAQLRHLKARAEGRLPPESARDVLAGLEGAGAIAVAMLTPFLRPARSHWGVDAETAARRYPGDDLVVEPRWSWTHGVAIDVPADAVWPWVAQIGADRGGFYSYQWLENLAGCNVRNAETIHEEWAVREGEALVLHPKVPPLRIVSVAPGRSFVAYAAPDEGARAAGKPWVAATWLFAVEPLGAGRSRFISRYRADCSDDLSTRLAFGPAFVEPVGFVMDRQMLLGVKARAEARAHVAPVRA
jgi:hypothetical protein